MKHSHLLSASLLLASVLASSPALASSTNGTIDATNHYAWSETTGWIDFGAIGGNVQVTDSGLTGYAWGAKIGWINLQGVLNNGGTLSGDAWSETTGYIDFKPTGGGVTIDSSGNFSGYAWGPKIGWISFNCSNAKSCQSGTDYKVSTDWRPASARTSSSSRAAPVTPAPIVHVQPSGGSRGVTGGTNRMGISMPSVPVSVLGEKQNLNSSSSISQITTDSNGLTWTHCPIGQTWDGTVCLGTISPSNRATSPKACVALGAGWRLPTMDELLSVTFLPSSYNNAIFWATDNAWLGNSATYDGVEMVRASHDASLSLSVLCVGGMTISVPPSGQASSTSVSNTGLRRFKSLSSSSVTHPSAPEPFANVPADAWYAQAALQAVNQGWMKSTSGNFLPAGTVTGNDLTTALLALHIDTSSLPSLPSDPSAVLTKGQFLQILTEAFPSQLQTILKTKSQAEYTNVWNAIPDAVSHHNAVRMSILAGWITMPRGTFHGSAPITRAEMAKILVNVVGTVGK